MDNPVMSKNLVDAINLCIDTKLAQYNFITFAKILKINGNYTIDVKPLAQSKTVNILKNTSEYKEYPEIKGIPYLCLTEPIIGDNCVLLHFDKNVEMGNNVVVENNVQYVKGSNKPHALNNCVAICGFKNIYEDINPNAADTERLKQQCNEIIRSANNEAIEATFTITEANTIVEPKYLEGLTTIDWGDGSDVELINDTDGTKTYKHTYKTVGTYEAIFKNVSKIHDRTTMIDNVYVHLSGFYGISCLTNIKIPNTITHIGGWVFAYTGLTEIVFPRGITTIYNNTCEHCPNLKTVVISDTITFIGNSAFTNTGLENVNIPDNVVNIGAYAFLATRSEYANLKTVKIGNGVLVLQHGSFAGQSNLSVVEINAQTPPTLEMPSAEENIPATINNILVPSNCVSAYRNATNWSTFGGKITSKELLAHPVGSIYISTNNISPAYLFGGNWSELPANKVLQIVSVSTGTSKQTINAGLPNIKGTFMPGQGDGGGAAAFSNNTGFSRSGALDIGSVAQRRVLDETGNNYSGGELTFDANKYNSIYNDSVSTVQPPAYTVYGWERVEL